ncbi:uncharacterized protein LOC144101825 [Amblyomma americanum]
MAAPSFAVVAGTRAGEADGKCDTMPKASGKCYIVEDMRMFMYSYDLKMTSENDLPPLPMSNGLHFRVILAATKRCDISLYQVVPHAASGGIPKAVQEGITSIPASLRVTLAHVILVQGLYEQSPLYAECSGFECLVMVYIRLLARNEGIENKIEVLQILNTYFARLFGTNDVLDDRVERKSELRVKERERRKLNNKCKKNKDNKDDDFGGDFSSASASEEEDDDNDCYGARRDDFSYMNKKERQRLQWISNKKQLKRLQRRQQVARDLAARNKREREDRVRMLADRAKQRRVNDPTYVTLDRAVLAHCFDPDSGSVVCFTPVGRKGSCRRVECSRMAHCANPNVGDIHYVYQLNGRFEFTYATVHAMFNGLFSSEEHWLNPLLEMLPDEGYVSTFKALYRKMCVLAADNRSYMHMFWNWMAPSVNASIERASKMMDQQQSAVVAPSTTTEKIIANMTTKQVGCTFAAIAVHGADSYDTCKETLLSKQHMTNPLIRRKHWEAVTKQFAPLLKRVNTYISYLCHRILNAQVELQDMANFGSMLLGGNSDAYTLPSPVGGSESVVYEQPVESETWMYEQFRALFPHQRDLDSVTEINPDMFTTMLDAELPLYSWRAITHGVTHFWISIIAYYMSFRAMYAHQQTQLESRQQMKDPMVVVKDYGGGRGDQKESCSNGGGRLKDAAVPSKQRTCVLVFWCNGDDECALILLERLYWALHVVLRLHAGQGEVNRKYKNVFANNVFLHTFMEKTDKVELVFSDSNVGCKMEFNTLHILFCASSSGDRPPLVVLPQISVKQRTPGRRCVSFVKMSPPHRMAKTPPTSPTHELFEDRTKSRRVYSNEYYTSREAVQNPLVADGIGDVVVHEQKYTDYICPRAIVNTIRRRCGDMIASDSLSMDFLSETYFGNISSKETLSTISVTNLGMNILRATRYFTGHMSANAILNARAHHNAVSATIGALTQTTDEEGRLTELVAEKSDDEQRRSAKRHATSVEQVTESKGESSTPEQARKEKSSSKNHKSDVTEHASKEKPPVRKHKSNVTEHASKEKHVEKQASGEKASVKKSTEHASREKPSVEKSTERTKKTEHVSREKPSVEKSKSATTEHASKERPSVKKSTEHASREKPSVSKAEHVSREKPSVEKSKHTSREKSSVEKSPAIASKEKPSAASSKKRFNYLMRGAQYQP